MYHFIDKCDGGVAVVDMKYTVCGMWCKDIDHCFTMIQHNNLGEKGDILN